MSAYRPETIRLLRAVCAVSLIGVVLFTLLAIGRHGLSAAMATHGLGLFTVSLANLVAFGFYGKASQK